MGPWIPGKTVLHYQIHEKIGEGGMGEVYRAVDSRLVRPVAIKVLSSDSGDPAARLRLMREARAASALNHPNIVTVHAIEESEGDVFMVMEFIAGQTLSEWVESERPDFHRFLDIAIQVTDAVAAAHSAGIIHRDLKPRNVMIKSRGQAKVLDFGLARSYSASVASEMETADATAMGVVSGTVPYMSPEQTRGELLDARTDVFSLGAVLYEAATGQRPFNGISTLALMHAIAVEEPLRCTVLNRDLPREFDLILSRALAKQKELRHNSAAELTDALAALRESRRTPLDEPAADLESEKEVHSAFVGREPETNRLSDCLRQSLDGSGKLVFLTGEPGIGKSALAEEFLRTTRRHYPSLVISRGRCVEQYGTGETYLPFLDAISSLLEGYSRDRIRSVLRTHAPTWCLQLPAAFSSTSQLEQMRTDAIGATRDRMMREFGDALGALAASTPVVLFLEDLHWADPSTIDLLRHLAIRITSQRVFLVATFRPEDLEIANHPLKKYKAEMQAHNQCQEISLGMLSREHIASYLNLRFSPNDFPPDFPDLIARKTEGHPLFTTSLVQFLVDHGDLAKPNAHWTLTRPLRSVDLEFPEGVRNMIRKKIEALAEEDRTALQYASIQGEEFSSTIVAELLEKDELDLEEQLARISRKHKLIEIADEEEMPDGSLATRYRFAHALYQNLLYDDLVSKRRIALHRRAGESLLKHFRDQAPRIAAQLALHFERGREFARAVEFLTHAGDAAVPLYANIEAEALYTRALSLLERLPADEQAPLELSLCEKRGAVNLALGKAETGVDDYNRMLDRARKLGNSAQEANALNRLGQVLFYAHRLDDMQVAANAAVEAAERAGSETARLDTISLLIFKHLAYGELDELKPIAEDSARMAAAIGYKPALLAARDAIAFRMFFQSEYQSSEQILRESVSLASELRDGFTMMMVNFFFLPMAVGNQGRISEALQLFHLGIKRSASNGDVFWSTRLLNCIGWIHREMQDFEQATKYDSEGAEVARRFKVLEAEANSLINLGIDSTHAHQDVLPLFQQVDSIFSRDAWFRWRYNIRHQAAQCEYWLGAGDLARAREFADRLLDEASRRTARKYVATAHALRARIHAAQGQFAETETQFGGALKILRDFPAILTAWRTWAALGSCRARAGNETGSRQAFSEAAVLVRQIAANVTDESLRNTFLKSAAVGEVFRGEQEAAGRAAT